MLGHKHEREPDASGHDSSGAPRPKREAEEPEVEVQPQDELEGAVPEDGDRLGDEHAEQLVAEAAVPPLPVHHDPLDQSLVGFLQLCDTAAGIPEDFAQQVAAHVAQDVDVARCHALQLAIKNGVSKREHIEAILLHGGSVNAGASAGNTALHCAATKSSAAAVVALLTIGADRETANLNGKTPFDVAHRPPRAPGLEPFANVNPCDCQAVEAAKQLAEQPPLTDGCLTPRMLARMRCVAHIADRTNRARIEHLQFQNRKPRNVADLDACLVWFQDLPEAAFGRCGCDDYCNPVVFKSFVMGFAAIVEAVATMLDPVEYVLELLLRDAEESGAAVMSSLHEDESALPAHVLDGDYDLRRHKMLHSRLTAIRGGGVFVGAMAHLGCMIGGVSEHP
ncbi:hypothetical protein FOA52_008138 [Chlamydomonas sp. UWO 241]|nr:hypothetical protein FOA52_008138 [Chlamydomonas sp. UWO 241]